MELEKIDLNGGYNPYELKWNETITFPSTRKLTEYGNKVYNRYPARSVFLVPRAILNHFPKMKNLSILDPFMGSGTTAVEASNFNCKIYGVEMDPFARMIAEASILRFNDIDLLELSKYKEAILVNLSKTKLNIQLTPKLKNIEHWFDDEVFKDILKLKTCIFETVNEDKFLKFFLISLADAIKPASKMERQSTKPYISSKYKKKTKPVLESFEYSFKKHLDALKQFKRTNKTEPKITWIGEDATNFNFTKSSINLAITSPPYLNAFDYTQVIKVESAWLGLLDDESASTLRSTQVGHEKRRHQEIRVVVSSIFKKYYDQIINSDNNSSKSEKLKIANTCLAYFNDIYSNLILVNEALLNEGEYHMIIGDNTIKGVEIPTHKLIAELSQDVGFEWFGYYKYPIKDHRTSIPRNDNGGKIKYEFVIMLKKK
ncbi:DNA methylase [Legionella pneumophila]|uniref:DNA methyltransferase n=1 Tax=Legionella pneumophila TaxID=446 RepID=UPI0007708B16|nr:DNA methyltransferase [Legionella pneumophila]MDI9824479.1 DNA methyltransferase [Legionella pneumophila]CZP77110.1 DNA methylase [Legionella pneumophila]HDV5821454.1 hypothetical protein [Legionella pneumophila]